jgi:hypothetical protein
MLKSIFLPVMAAWTQTGRDAATFTNQGIQMAVAYWVCMVLYNAVSAMLPRLLIIEDKYTKAIEESPRVRIALLTALNETCMIWSESSFWKGAQIGSGWGVDRWLRFVTHVKFEEKNIYRSPGQPQADPAISVVVFRWRMFTSPLVQHAIHNCASDIPQDNKILVVRASSASCYGIHSATEIAIPPTCPTLRVSMAVADDMLDMYRRSGLGGIVLTGRPGVGKSIATRCFAHKLMAVYGHFSTNNNIEKFLDAHTMSQKTHMVLVIDEVDNDIDAMLAPAEQRSASDQDSAPKPMTKKAWCALFDRLMFYPNVVVVATTNKSVSWLTDMDAKNFDGALFRRGRFNHFIDFDNLETTPKKNNKRMHKRLVPSRA